MVIASNIAIMKGMSKWLNKGDIIPVNLKSTGKSVAQK